MRYQFYAISIVVFIMTAFVGHFWPAFYVTTWVSAPIFLIGVLDIIQKKEASVGTSQLLVILGIFLKK